VHVTSFSLGGVFSGHGVHPYSFLCLFVMLAIVVAALLQFRHKIRLPANNEMRDV